MRSKVLSLLSFGSQGMYCRSLASVCSLLHSHVQLTNEEFVLKGQQSLIEFCWIQNLTTVFTRARHWYLSQDPPGTVPHCLCKIHLNVIRLSVASSVSRFPTFAIGQVVGRPFLTVEVQVHYEGSLCNICGGRSGTATGFSPSRLLWFYPVSYHNTSAPYYLSTVAGTVGPLAPMVSRV